MFYLSLQDSSDAVSPRKLCITVRVAVAVRWICTWGGSVKTAVWGSAELWECWLNVRLKYKKLIDWGCNVIREMISEIPKNKYVTLWLCRKEYFLPSLQVCWLRCSANPNAWGKEVKAEGKRKRRTQTPGESALPAGYPDRCGTPVLDWILS